jgi:hypothetical protein
LSVLWVAYATHSTLKLSTGGILYIYKNWYKGKSKTVLLNARTGPEGFRRLRLTDFKTIGT